MSTVSQFHRRTVASLLVAGLIGAAMTLLDAGTASAQPSMKELESRVHKASSQLEAIVEDYDDTVDKLHHLKKRHAADRETITPLRDRVRESERQVGDLSASLYESGPWVTVTPFVGATPDDLADRMSTLDYLAADRETKVSRLTEATRLLDTESAKIKDLSSERARLESRKHKKEAAIRADQASLRRLRDNAMGQGYQDTPGLKAPPVPGGSAGAAATAVSYANGALGAPYQWGGTGNPGYDCSGLTSAAWGAAGVSLPHSASAQYATIAHVSRGELQPGDLVFYYSDIHHVGMYVGDGKIIHAPNEGQTVRVATIDQGPIVGYGRPG
ncbi:MAG TPA: NlpC/P60 family protein [Stackebrandtia sp.]|jgi:cell wall-associated NlpC family hydrolase|uniref:C40 family peptidase n=1 Tax=Stackebrandtia sp. TaxID=2023065 RepID=UPI002D32CEEF|nr:NlpC/P60 family protein [Stackebrandtia sp.]HZE38561.1 NlpC/P60 family protein [Stackebrandtia sp.]